MVIRLTDEENEIFESKIKNTNLSKSQYVKALILDEKLPVRLPEPDYKELISELRKIHEEIRRIKIKRGCVNEKATTKKLHNLQRKKR